MSKRSRIMILSILALIAAAWSVRLARPTHALGSAQSVEFTLPLTQSLIVAYHNGATRLLTDIIPVGNREGQGLLHNIALGIQEVVSDTLYYRGYLGFDTASIPHGSTVLQAHLELYVDHFEYQGAASPGETIHCGIYQVTGAWPGVDEPSWDWADNPPVTTTAAVSISIPFDRRGVYTLNVSSLVQAWVNGEANYGLMIGMYPDPDSVGRLTAIVHGPAAISETLRPRLAIEFIPRRYTIYLPILVRTPDLRSDLVVEAIGIDPENPGITWVRIGNQGMITALNFWTDIYLDPDPSPSQVNQAWPQLSWHGGTWLVEKLEAGESMTLTIEDEFYQVKYSLWPTTTYPAGNHAAWVYVDSWGPPSPLAAVDEINEANNRYGPMTFTATGTVSMDFEAAPFTPILPRPLRSGGN